MRPLGIVLIVIGAVALGYQGFTYAGDRPPPLPTTIARRDQAVWVPPVVGGVALVAGVMLLSGPKPTRRARG